VWVGRNTPIHCWWACDPGAQFSSKYKRASTQKPHFYTFTQEIIMDMFKDKERMDIDGYIYVIDNNRKLENNLNVKQ
jgi:hypothetical protein